MFFFFNDTATTEIYTLSLHDALPICRPHRAPRLADSAPRLRGYRADRRHPCGRPPRARPRGDRVRVGRFELAMRGRSGRPDLTLETRPSGTLAAVHRPLGRPGMA